jgi:hypothetical protein
MGFGSPELHPKLDQRVEPATQAVSQRGASGWQGSQSGQTDWTPQPPPGPPGWKPQQAPPASASWTVHRSCPGLGQGRRGTSMAGGRPLRRRLSGANGFVITVSVAPNRDTYDGAKVRFGSCVHRIPLMILPARDSTPSPDDLRLTAEALAAGRLLDIQLLDHLIVAGDGFISLRDRGVAFDRTV